MAEPGARHGQKAEDREVAGIRCTGVLARLSDYLDGELDEAARRTVDLHLAGCDWCARFGGHMSGVVQALRAELGDHDNPEERDAEAATALLEKLGVR